MSKKPNPEVFAKHVLWNLCGIQARLKEVESMLAFDMAKRNNVAVNKILDASAARQLISQNELYADAVLRSGLDGGGSSEPNNPRN